MAFQNLPPFFNHSIKDVGICLLKSYTICPKLLKMLAAPHFALLLIFASFSLALAGHEEDLRAEFAAYKCNKGYIGKMLPEHDDAMKKCNEKNIKSYACYMACFTTENGVYKNGEADDAERAKDLATLFDDSPESKATVDKWMKEGKTCAEVFKKNGRKVPTEYSGDCADYKSLRTCVTASRKC